MTAIKWRRTDESELPSGSNVNRMIRSVHRVAAKPKTSLTDFVSTATTAADSREPMMSSRPITRWSKTFSVCGDRSQNYARDARRTRTPVVRTNLSGRRSPLFRVSWAPSAVGAVGLLEDILDGSELVVGASAALEARWARPSFGFLHHRLPASWCSAMSSASSSSSSS